MSWTPIIMIVLVGLVNLIVRIASRQKRQGEPPQPGPPPTPAASARVVVRRPAAEPGTSPRVTEVQARASQLTAASHGAAGPANEVRPGQVGRSPPVPASQNPPPRGVSLRRTSRKPMCGKRLRDGLIASVILSPPPSA